MTYVYPAIFEPEGTAYNVVFPDLEGCSTCGDDLADALKMAEDALCLTLMDMEDSGDAIPAPSPVGDLKCGEGEVISLVRADTEAYRRLYSNRAVKKTLTIPYWMNEAALQQGLNFSKVLQEALKERLNRAGQ